MICKYCGDEITSKNDFDRFIKNRFNINMCDKCLEEYEKQLRDLKRRRIDIYDLGNERL
jgi:hypothetical protein